MFASVEHPVLRLVRHKIGNWHLSDLEPGQYKNNGEFTQKLLKKLVSYRQSLDTDVL